MDVKDRQCLLTVLKRSDGTSYYTGEVDGIYGRLSRIAIQDFQRDFGGLKVTGEADSDTDQAMRHAVAYGIPDRDLDVDVPDNSADVSDTLTGTFWDEIEFFDREEFRCKCGGKYCNGFPAEPKETMVRIADRLRKNLGVPIRVISGLRCPTWNSIQGGVANSQHMYGEAADIYAVGYSQAQVEAELDRIGGVRYHYAITGSSNVHFDVPKGAR